MECRYSGARKGIGGIREHWGSFEVLGLLGASGGVGGVRSVLELAGSVGTQVPEGIGGI